MIRLYCGQRSVEILRNCMYFEKKRVRDLYSRYVHASVFIGRVLRRVEFILGAPCKSKSINIRGGNAVGMSPSLFFFLLASFCADPRSADPENVFILRLYEEERDTRRNVVPAIFVARRLFF